MTFLLWALLVILLLSLVNAVACWFGVDIASEQESEPDLGEGSGHRGVPLADVPGHGVIPEASTHGAGHVSGTGPSHH